MGLFSTTHIHESSPQNVYVNKNVKVTEVKAPTDESVRLLKEMEEAALNKLVYSAKIETNMIKGVVFLFQQNLGLGVDMVLRFNLNGKDYKYKETFDRRELDRLDSFVRSRGIHESEVIRAIHKRFADVIVKDLLQETVNAMSREGRR